MKNYILTLIFLTFCSCSSDSPTKFFLKRVSVGINGVESDGDSAAATISEDGRFVVFESAATNLVANDTNTQTDIFIYDNNANQTKLVNLSSDGSQASSRSSSRPHISPNGQYVVYDSSASNLVLGDTNNLSDIFVRNLASQTTSRVSIDSNGQESNGNSYTSGICNSGRFVVFSSVATNLVPGDTNGNTDIFVHDLQTLSTIRISVDSVGTQSNGESENPSISSDCRYVVFSSFATNLVADDNNGASDVFLHDLETNVTSLISVSSSGLKGSLYSGVGQNAISSDGRYVVFVSSAPNLVAGDTNGLTDVFLRDLQQLTTKRVTVDSNGNQFNPSIDRQGISLSNDGRFVSYILSDSNIILGDNNGFKDVFVYNSKSGLVSRISVSLGGNQADNLSNDAKISGNGKYIVFSSNATNLVSADTNLSYDVFLKTIP